MGLFDFLKGGSKSKEEATKKYLLEKITTSEGFVIPRAFETHSKLIAGTKRDTVAIEAKPDTELTLHQSKFGHYPLLPVGFDYPKDGEGNYMYPLAQINFSEAPTLLGFPASGYLQFYISVTDDVYGLDFDQPQSQQNFKVLFFEEDEVQAYQTDFAFLEDTLSSGSSPVYKSHGLRFKKEIDYLGIGEVGYDKTLLNAVFQQHASLKDELEDELYQCFTFSGHKLGGYAYFTQWDPREDHLVFKDYRLLFQLDSDDEIMWGDVGVANFFIHPDDLAKKDFSKVLYNWDCS